MRQNDLSERLFRFSVRTIKYLRKIPFNDETKVLKNQLIKSSSSTCANYEESQAGSSKADFANKVRISLREMRETIFWLRLMKELDYQKYDVEEFQWLENESKELSKILGSICQKSK
ncbi:MAG TPA: four helix bundle protein [Bacteroidales bacterium]